MIERGSPYVDFCGLLKRFFKFFHGGTPLSFLELNLKGIKESVLKTVLEIYKI